MTTDSILLFTRGRGFGHAIPDMAIADELKRIGAGERIMFASYSNAYQTLKGSGRETFDLGMPDKNPFLLTLIKAAELVQRIRPTLVVAHEEFAALPASRLAGVPAVYLGAWLPDANSISSESLNYANGIILLNDPGLFALPPNVTARLIHTGPILRIVKFTRNDRDQVRSQMGLDRDALVIAVIPGGASPEEQSPIAQKVVDCFARVPDPNKHLLWLGGKDCAKIANAFGSVPGFRALDYTETSDRIIAASNVVITKGTRSVTLDCMSAGVPSISLSPGTNPMDDLLVPRMKTNTPLFAKAVDGSVLYRYLTEVLERERRAPLAVGIPGEGAAAAAVAILDELKQVRRDNTPLDVGGR